METIFKTVPRNFVTPVNMAGFDIVGISCKTHETELGNKGDVKFTFRFYVLKDNEYVVKDTIDFMLPKRIMVPGVGNIDIVAGFFSSNPATVFQVASVLAGYYQYALLPYEQQDQLIQNYV